MLFFIFVGELEPLETSVDLCNVLTSGAKFCKHCDTAVQANMVKYKKSELEPLLTKSEKDESHDELYFCDENCYFQFAIGRADKVSFQKKNFYVWIRERNWLFQTFHRLLSLARGTYRLMIYRVPFIYHFIREFKRKFYMIKWWPKGTFWKLLTFKYLFKIF